MTLDLYIYSLKFGFKPLQVQYVDLDFYPDLF